jgi:hypothetical protein
LGTEPIRPPRTNSASATGWNEHADYRGYNPSNQRWLSQSLRKHCLRQLFEGRGNQSQKSESLKALQDFSFHFLPRSRGTAPRQLAYPANAETRMMIQRLILAEYEKIVGNGDSAPSARSASERLRALDQLKTDGLINEEEYNTKRKKILGEL